ncbi:uncharacterized protein LOC109832117 [Asparagus officinalis]|uniref:uncharacterized protein LOC109832117 n=1 Tax=Asparagus officinalis TaxID=4686 RepID=UPI00098E10AA|nr:uncharacterized protein LOC109832117 [Asparagus officinalis]
MEKQAADQYSSLLNQIFSHPLFSILTTFLLLNFLYLPNLFSLLFSPVLIITSLLLTILLHFGSPKPEPSPNKTNPIQTQHETRHEPPHDVELQDEKTSILCNSFAEWGRRSGPLEVIYEEYEGEAYDVVGSPEYSKSPEYYRVMMSARKRLDCFGYGSSTDSDADSDESLENNISFRWDDEEEEGMIEIALEEDNLIEIDLSACK